MFVYVFPNTVQVVSRFTLLALMNTIIRTPFRRLFLRSSCCLCILACPFSFLIDYTDSRKMQRKRKQLASALWAVECSFNFRRNINVPGRRARLAGKGVKKGYISIRARISLSAVIIDRVQVPEILPTVASYALSSPVHPTH